ncbi:hypothetical protein BDZ94DRAFT_588746 [Collybia nuda]|uniref:Uncharacterized protein n=1 Tax=Collybia nuda TaxID=64659 RepID=A0A9P5Y7N2_9AGAR|nr:hypothetical protein BDZ94DRAFT_588746 [Collybia nuda]
MCHVPGMSRHAWPWRLATPWRLQLFQLDLQLPSPFLILNEEHTGINFAPKNLKLIVLVRSNIPQEAEKKSYRTVALPAGNSIKVGVKKSMRVVFAEKLLTVSRLMCSIIRLYLPVRPFEPLQRIIDPAFFKYPMLKCTGEISCQWRLRTAERNFGSTLVAMDVEKRLSCLEETSPTHVHRRD